MPMNEELERPEDVEAAMPKLDIPDGVGISYEDLAVLFAMKNDTSVSKKDPVMIMVTVCNAFLEKARQLHDQHNEALTKILTAKTQDYITSVKTTTDAFTSTLSQASVEGIRKIFEEHASELQASKWNFRWCALIVAVSALANVIALACK